MKAQLYFLNVYYLPMIDVRGGAETTRRVREQKLANVDRYQCSPRSFSFRKPFSTTIDKR
ncbi:hypothetical protein BDZ89DRAFT_1065003 [Hymenopellis radicata]|nr:hypothetical protein BDZ89DRAFT_1065003 [Hymenopellis radicata]